MTILKNQTQIVEEFSKLQDWQSRYRKIIQTGKLLPRLDPSLRTEENRIKGCQSQVWLHARLEDELLIFEAGTDSILVRGLVALVLRVFSGHSPKEILAAKVTFINDLGLGENLSQNRSNGLIAMIKQIQYYALAFQALLDRK